MDIIAESKYSHRLSMLFGHYYYHLFILMLLGLGGMQTTFGLLALTVKYKARPFVPGDEIGFMITVAFVVVITGIASTKKHHDEHICLRCARFVPPSLENDFSAFKVRFTLAHLPFIFCCIFLVMNFLAYTRTTSAVACFVSAVGFSFCALYPWSRITHDRHKTWCDICYPRNGGGGDDDDPDLDPEPGPSHGRKTPNLINA